MPPDSKRENFWNHISSLRSHFLWAGFIFISISLTLFFYASDYLIELLVKPVNSTPLVFLTPLGPFLFKLQISLYGGFIIFCPILAGIILHFVFPALIRRQKVAAVLFVGVSLILSALSVFLAYWYLIPHTLDFLIKLVVPGTSLLLTTQSYISFFILEIIVTYILLQIPLLIVMLAYFNVVSPHTLAKERRILYISLLIVLAIATPTTDALTLFIVFLPAILLVEGGLAIAKAL